MPIIERAAGALNLFEDIGRLRGPDEGFGVLVVFFDVLFDGDDQFFGIVKAPRRSRFCVRSRKKRSTMFSHELLVGVKCM